MYWRRCHKHLWDSDINKCSNQAIKLFTQNDDAEREMNGKVFFYSENGWWCVCLIELRTRDSLHLLKNKLNVPLVKSVNETVEAFEWNHRLSSSGKLFRRPWPINRQRRFMIHKLFTHDRLWDALAYAGKFSSLSNQMFL